MLGKEWEPLIVDSGESEMISVSRFPSLLHSKDYSCLRNLSRLDSEPVVPFDDDDCDAPDDEKDDAKAKKQLEINRDDHDAVIAPLPLAMKAAIYKNNALMCEEEFTSTSTLQAHAPPADEDSMALDSIDSSQCQTKPDLIISTPEHSTTKPIPIKTVLPTVTVEKFIMLQPPMVPPLKEPSNSTDHLQPLPPRPMRASSTSFHVKAAQTFPWSPRTSSLSSSTSSTRAPSSSSVEVTSEARQLPPIRITHTLQAK
jgi:hypothetical protein